jgi:hypothetical protein
MRRTHQNAPEQRFRSAAMREVHQASPEATFRWDVMRWAHRRSLNAVSVAEPKGVRHLPTASLIGWPPTLRES